MEANQPDVPVYLGALVPKVRAYRSMGPIRLTWDGFAIQEPYGAVDLVRHPRSRP